MHNYVTVIFIIEESSILQKTQFNCSSFSFYMCISFSVFLSVCFSFCFFVVCLSDSLLVSHPLYISLLCLSLSRSLSYHLAKPDCKMSVCPQLLSHIQLFTNKLKQPRLSLIYQPTEKCSWSGRSAATMKANFTPWRFVYYFPSCHYITHVYYSHY